MEKENRCVLFVDDDPAFLSSIIRTVERLNPGFKCIRAHDENEAIEAATKNRPGVIVLDLVLQQREATFLIPAFLGLPDPARILILSGSGDTDRAILCLEAGAASYLVKPVAIPHLLALIADGLHVTELLKKARATPRTMDTVAALGLSTRTNVMTAVLDDAAFAASSSQPVLLCGETGVGKGIIAQAIHSASKRSGKPFVRTQPHFGSHDLTMSELFGHVRGAFTGASDARKGLLEEADGGTLFLDEVDSLPQETQVALLHALQEKEFYRMGSSKLIRSDFRLISATNTPRPELVQPSKLRTDFFHRIGHHVIEIPPLRERRADIPLLAQAALNKLMEEDPEHAVFGISAEAVAWLSSQQWPGNVREMQATVEHGYNRAKYRNCTIIKPCDLQPHRSPSGSSLCVEKTLSAQLREFELSVANTTLAKNESNYSATARALGIDRKRLRRILAQVEFKA